jgi:hypothetical protein
MVAAHALRLITLIFNPIANPNLTKTWLMHNAHALYITLALGAIMSVIIDT